MHKRLSEAPASTAPSVLRTRKAASTIRRQLPEKNQQKKLKFSIFPHENVQNLNFRNN